MQTRIRNIVGPIFHLTVFIHHIYGCYKTFVVIDTDVVTEQKVLDVTLFAPVLFTAWNIAIQTIYFALATLYDFLYIFSLKPDLQEKLTAYRGYIFTSLLFPCSLCTFTTFWGVYSVNREWVLPEVLDAYIPSWLNHFFHTNILVFVIIEVLIVNQLLPTMKSAFIGLTILIGTYSVLFISSYIASGRWAYGIMFILSWPERILFMATNYIFTIIVMKLGIYIENFKHNLIRKHSNKLKS